MRRYMAHRRAWFPRLWPLVLLAFVAMQPALWLTSGWWRPGLEVVSAVAATWLRLEFWRWRHPVISPEEYLDDLRSRAQWN